MSDVLLHREKAGDLMRVAFRTKERAERAAWATYEQTCRDTHAAHDAEFTQARDALAIERKRRPRDEAALAAAEQELRGLADRRPPSTFAAEQARDHALRLADTRLASELKQVRQRLDRGDIIE